MVDCPQYLGPPFFSHPPMRTWVPLQPLQANADFDPAVTRTQFPLTLGWALTPWKAQGMTLHKVVVELGSKASSPCVTFVALTRVRHPDDLLLEDSFPSMQALMKQRNHPSFQARQRWEQQQEALFARTLRKFMRDRTLYSETNVWNSEDAALADWVNSGRTSTTAHA